MQNVHIFLMDCQGGGGGWSSSGSGGSGWQSGGGGGGWQSTIGFF